MEIANKNLVVLPELCKECDDCFRVECQLCRPCFMPKMRLILSQSYLEHQNQMDFQRIFPPPIVSKISAPCAFVALILIKYISYRRETWCLRITHCRINCLLDGIKESANWIRHGVIDAITTCNESKVYHV